MITRQEITALIDAGHVHLVWDHDAGAWRLVDRQAIPTGDHAQDSAGRPVTLPQEAASWPSLGPALDALDRRGITTVAGSTRVAIDRGR